jgi:outer membrane immunogenic protein
MKTRLLTTVAAAVALTGFIGVAQAADLVPQDTVIDWSGMYVGAQIGFGDANMSGCIECSSGSATFADDLNLNGITGGLHAGYNWQSDAIVFGIEGDINLNDWKDRANSGDSLDEYMKASVDALGSIRGRLGIASGDALFYLTGGVALSNAELKSIRDDVVDTAKFNNLGAVVGGGVELMAFANTSIRAEGLYYIFNDKVDTSNWNECGTCTDMKLEDMFVVRVGASWHFN